MDSARNSLFWLATGSVVRSIFGGACYAKLASRPRPMTGSDWNWATARSRGPRRAVPNICFAW